MAGPQGIATDSKGHLFVTNYAKGTTVDALVAEDPEHDARPAEQPRCGRGLPVDEHRRRRQHVRNQLRHRSACTFPERKRRARVLSDSGISKGYDIAFDHKGNCYLMGYSAAFSGNNTIDEFAGCTGEPQSTGVIGLLNGLAFDGSDNLYFSQQGNQLPARSGTARD